MKFSAEKTSSIINRLSPVWDISGFIKKTQEKNFSIFDGVSEDEFSKLFEDSRKKMDLNIEDLINNKWKYNLYLKDENEDKLHNLLNDIRKSRRFQNEDNRKMFTKILAYLKNNFSSSYSILDEILNFIDNEKDFWDLIYNQKNLDNIYKVLLDTNYKNNNIIFLFDILSKWENWKNILKNHFKEIFYIFDFYLKVDIKIFDNMLKFLKINNSNDIINLLNNPLYEHIKKNIKSNDKKWIIDFVSILKESKPIIIDNFIWKIEFNYRKNIWTCSKNEIQNLNIFRWENKDCSIVTYNWIVLWHIKHKWNFINDWESDKQLEASFLICDKNKKLCLVKWWLYSIKNFIWKWDFEIFELKNKIPLNLNFQRLTEFEDLDKLVYDFLDSNNLKVT